MNTRKWLAVLLCLLLGLSALTGCAGEEAAEPAPTAAPGAVEPEEEQPPAEEPEEEAPDYEALYQAAMEKLERAREKYDPDTVVCTIEGQEMTWGMLFYFISADLQDVIYYTGDLPADFNEPLTETSTMGDYLNKSALSQAVYYAVANAVPAREGIAVPAEAEAAIGDYWEQLLEQYGGEEGLLAALKESGLDRELLMFFLRSNEALTAMKNARYGADSATDEEVLAWAREKGYVRTKHVLYNFYNEDGTPMDDEGKAAQRERADEVLAELSALAGDDAALEARFDEIMNAETGDAGGLANFPMGYTFTSGTMVAEYEEAAFALDDYALSDVVETSYGYHILLGLPLDPDGLTMDQDSATGAYMTLRETALNDLFNADLAEWINEAKVEWAAPEFENIDFNALFDIVPDGEE